MEEKKPPPPSYEESLASGASPSAAGSVNQGFEPEGATQSVPTAPPIRPYEPEIPPLLNLRSMTDPELREACQTYVDDNCCYGSRFIRDMILTDIRNDSAFQYTLESFGEKRESVDRTTGFYGQRIDGPENGPPPGPWDITVSRPAFFKDHETSTEIPHTAYVKQCFTCVGNRRVRCSSCLGEGTERCIWCDGSGKDGENDCSSCNGRGKRDCYICDATGMVDCRTCSGHGNLKHYRMLIVTWKNHKEEFISNNYNLPAELIRGVSGTQLFVEQRERVQPITNAMDPTINIASSQMISKHNNSFRRERILVQRHNLRAVPITKAFYIWRNKKGEFYVYGYQNNVYFENYPQKCCCCVCC